MVAMLRGFSRRFFLTTAAGFVATATQAAAPASSLRPQGRGVGFAKKAVRVPEAIVAEAGLSGRISFAVADVKTGLRLEGQNAQTGAPPASVAKAVTALYALDVLGPSHRFQTRLIATGTVSGGVVSGDLILAGGGDPALDTNTLATLAAALKAAGVREVRGDFKVYDGALPRIDTIDSDQPAHVGYSPALSGIALNYNRVHFEWRRSSGGFGVTMDARSDKYRPDVAMARMRIVARDTPVYSYKSTARTDEWTVARGALGNGGARWLPVRKPALYAGDVFQTMARSQGIPLKAPKVISTLPQGQVLVRHQSDDLRTLLKGMLRFSTNVTAEMVGMAATAKRNGTPRSLQASASEMNNWARRTLGIEGLRLVDHSGLGEDSRVTADAMVAALVKVHNNGVLRPILKAIAMRDAKGRPIKTHPIKVQAKTGTLNFVSSLAGYMTARDGTVLAFAIFAADEDQRKRIRKADREAPRGARSYNKRAKQMQQKLIERWGTLYGS